MPFQKQEYYEGAALHVIVRTRTIESIHYIDPFFVLNKRVSVLLKYTRKVRSPWGFTVTEDEQIALGKSAGIARTVLGLVCGSDGVAVLPYEAYLAIAGVKNGAVHIACYRDHGEHYEISGPAGILPRKVAPSNWQKILQERDSDQ